MTSEPAPVPPGAKVITLASLRRKPKDTTKRKPTRLLLSGIEPIDVESWRDVVVNALTSTNALAQIGVPRPAGPRAKRYFINSTPHHADGGKMKAAHPVEWNGERVFLELHYSAQNLVCILADTLEAAGVSLSDVSVEFA